MSWLTRQTAVAPRMHGIQAHPTCSAPAAVRVPGHARQDEPWGRRERSACGAAARACEGRAAECRQSPCILACPSQIARTTGTLRGRVPSAGLGTARSCGRCTALRTRHSGRSGWFHRCGAKSRRELSDRGRATALVGALASGSSTGIGSSGGQAPGSRGSTGSQATDLSEPGTWVLLGSSLAGLTFVQRQRERAA